MKSFSALVVATMASSALAFAPASTTQGSTSSLSAMPDRLWNTMVDKTERSKAVPFLPRAINLDGSYPADYGFDPFYLSSIPKDFAGFIQPPSWEETGGLPTLYWMREAELKHSRLAMMAVLGWLATDGVFGFTWRLPVDTFSVENIPNSYMAHDILVEQGTMRLMVFAVGLIEICTSAVLVQVSKGESDREAGDFKLGYRFFDGASDEFILDMKVKELNNGRLAMLAFGGIATQTAMGATEFPYFSF